MCQFRLTASSTVSSLSSDIILMSKPFLSKLKGVAVPVTWKWFKSPGIEVTIAGVSIKEHLERSICAYEGFNIKHSCQRCQIVAFLPESFMYPIVVPYCWFWFWPLVWFWPFFGLPVCFESDVSWFFAKIKEISGNITSLNLA